MRGTMHLTKDERKWYRKHWSTDDPNLFDWIVNTKGLVEPETEEQRERRYRICDALYAALPRLDKKIRQVVEWYYLKGMTLQVIATKQKTSVSTAYKRRERGLEKLRILLEGFAYER